MVEVVVGTRAARASVGVAGELAPQTKCMAFGAHLEFFSGVFKRKSACADISAVACWLFSCLCRLQQEICWITAAALRAVVGCAFRAVMASGMAFRADKIEGRCFIFIVPD